MDDQQMKVQPEQQERIAEYTARDAELTAAVIMAFAAGREIGAATKFIFGQ